ncbi:hypothetical protein RB653_004864 [Dictyostelium firmibasis]|uniref:GPR180/TMEM145 transmembrane domain-containing protein n=1 Tax=Dictyostelium firmibasis TaxID=79012 RepID=A0AAN7UAD5_9MYCE
MRLILSLLSIILLLNGINAINYSGKYLKPLDFRWIGKFCFDEKGGSIQVTRFQSTSNTTKILLYSDSNPHYDEILNDIGVNDISCQEKISWANYTYNNPDPIGLINEESRNYNVKKVSQNRDRFWAIVMADCDKKFVEDHTLPFRSLYTFDVQNSGDAFDSQLSAEQQSIPQGQIFFFILYTGFLIVSIVYSVILKKNRLEGKAIHFFSAILVVFLISLALYISNWAYILKFHKYEIKFLNLFGNIFEILGNGLFVALILMIGQGWTTSIYFGSLVKQIINIFVSLALVVIGWVAYVYYVYHSKEQNSYIYFMDTCPGYFLLALYVVIIGYFCWANYVNRNKQNESIKKNFILIFTLIFVFWLISHPLVVIVAHFMDPWVKYKVISLLNLAINAIFFIILLVIFRPSRNNMIVKILQSDDKSNDMKEIKDNEKQNNGADMDLNIAN